MQPVKSILWPSDASKFSVRSLETAVELAKQFGAKLYGLQVVPRVPIDDSGFAGPPIAELDIPKYEQRLRYSAEKALKQTVAEKVPEDVAVETHVEMGKASEVIINFAKELKVDLIVMVTHGRTGLSHLMIGSVTEDVIRRSPIPILVLPNKSGEE